MPRGLTTVQTPPPGALPAMKANTGFMVWNEALS